MRPLRLDVEGFTCYRERQQPLDFSSLSLFAIAGPTGAGKSSILDAMLYALYGEVPRIGKQGIGEFISHGRDVMSVCLDFRVSGRDFRVTRLSKRSKQGGLKTEASLAELVGGLEKSLADAVKPVNEKVISLLGLGYEEFIQTVVLPQGQFAQFLKADPKDQRAILQHLLRHDVFTRMRETAEDRRKALDGQVQILDGKISTYVDATPATIASREALLLEVRGQVEEATVASAAADAVLQEAQQRHALTREIAQLRRRLQEVEQQAPVVERARVELDQSRRAVPILPRLEAADKAATRADTAREAKDQAAKAVAEADLTRTRAATQFEAATAAAAECAALMLRVQALDEIAAEIARRIELTAMLAAAPPEINSAEAEAKTAAKSEAAARKKASQARSAVQSLKAAHDAVAFDEPLYSLIEATFAQVGDARAQERELAALTAESESATRARAVAERDEHAARAAHLAAGEQAEVVRREAGAARSALEDGRARHGAAALREHLHAGDQCPVCLQAVGEVPQVPAPPNWQRSNVPIAWPLIGRRTPTLRGRPRSTPWPPSPRDLSRLRPRRTAPLPGPRLAPRRSVFCWPHCRPPRPVLRRPVLARQCWTGSSSVAPNCWRQGASATARLRRSDRQRAAWPQPRWHSRTRWAMRKPPPSATSNWLRTRRESRRSLLVSTNGFTVLPPMPIRRQSVRPSSNVSPSCAIRNTTQRRRSPRSISR